MHQSLPLAVGENCAAHAVSPGLDLTLLAPSHVPTQRVIGAVGGTPCFCLSLRPQGPRRPCPSTRPPVPVTVRAVWRVACGPQMGRCRRRAFTGADAKSHGICFSSAFPVTGTPTLAGAAGGSNGGSR